MPKKTLDLRTQRFVDAYLGSAAGNGTAAAYRPAEPPSVFWASQDRVQVFEILSAYVRTTSHRPPIGPAGPDATLQIRQPDVNAALTVLARRTVLEGDPPLDLSGSLLPSARLGWAELARADLRGAHLQGARVSADTRWPAGFDWRAAGARMVDAC